MAEYISRQKALEEMHKWCDPCGSGIEAILAVPTADVAPVVHGHFVHDGPRFAGGVDWWRCSACGGLVSGAETQFAYCPNCGAKMDGGDNNAAD